MVRGELERFGHFVKRLRLVANETKDPHVDLMARNALAQQLLMTGEIEAAHEQAEHVFDHYDIEKHRHLAARHSEEDPGVICGVFDAMILWLLGCPSQSATRLLEGELLLDQDNEKHSEAEDCFERALEVARGQRAKSLELRAAVSLSRLWQRQRRPDDARRLLEPVYQWFKKDLDSEDLRDAKALLDELRRM